jgi:hypothetical protein
MPFFKTTKNILTIRWEDELFDPNWMDSDKLVLPPKVDWDYSRELKIEDVDIWEVLYEQGGGLGFYAAWSPYAEFYMITLPLLNVIPNRIETYYGPLASEKVYNRAKDFNINLVKNKIWVEEEDMWLFKKPEAPKLILIP